MTTYSEDNTNIYYVYIYKHPKTLVPFYVGKGKNDRYRKHLNPNADSNTDLLCEIKLLKDANLSPLIEFYATDLVEETAFKIEEDLISLYGRRRFDDNGCLVNIMKTGRPDMSIKQTPEYRELCRQNTLKLWEDPEYRVKVSSAIQKHYDEHPELLEIKRQITLDLWKDPEYIKNVEDSFTEERIENMSKKMSVVWETRDYFIKERERLSEQYIELWKDPEYRKNMCDMSRKNWEDPEYRKMQDVRLYEYWNKEENIDMCRDRMNKLWKTDVFRQKMIDSKNTPEYKEKVSGKNSFAYRKLRKRYIIYFEDGHRVEILGINEFCADFGYDPGGLHKVMTGRCKRHKDIIKIERLD